MTGWRNPILLAIALSMLPVKPVLPRLPAAPEQGEQRTFQRRGPVYPAMPQDKPVKPPPFASEVV